MPYVEHSIFEPEFLSIRDVATLLSISVPTVTRLMKQPLTGRPPLPAKKIGGCLRVRRSELEAWIEESNKPVKPVRGRPLGSTKAAMARRRAEAAQSEMAMSPTP